MDTIDLKALVRLMECGRVSWAELGVSLGLSAPAAAERVHKMEERGVIKGYAALIDPEAVGFGLTAYVALSIERPEHRASLLEKVMEMPEIQECHHIAGEDDYLLKVRCRGTKHLEHLVSTELKGLPGIIKTRTTIVLSSVKETPALPVKY